MSPINSVARKRLKRIDQDGSPLFRHSFGIIVAGAFEQIVLDTDIPGSAKYKPLDFMELTNNAAEDVEIEINNDAGNRIPLPSGVIKSFSRRSLWNVRIVNSDATDTSAGEIVAIFQKLPIDADEAARRAV